MPLSRVQLMAPPGGPGNFGAIKAGDNVTINEATGAVATPPGGVTRVLGGNGIVVTPPAGKGVTVTLSLATPAVTPFPVNTTILVCNGSAPPGYVKSTSFDNRALRLSSSSGGSTGGSVGFTSVFTTITPTGSFSAPSVSLSGNTSQSAWTPEGDVNQGSIGINGSSLSRGQNGRHSHAFNLGIPNGDLVLQNGFGESQVSSPVGTNDTGGNGPHSHGVNFNVGWNGNSLNHDHSWNASSGGGSGTFTGNAWGLNVKYIDAIVCVKS